MSTTSSLGKFVLGTLVGGALGAVVGMLLAPRSGVETREMIRDEVSSRYRDSKQALNEKSAALCDKVRHLGEELEETGRRTMDKFKTNGKTTTAASSESPVSN